MSTRLVAITRSIRRVKRIATPLGATREALIPVSFLSVVALIRAALRGCRMGLENGWKPRFKQSSSASHEAGGRGQQA
jgi:hypothetical protein